MADGGVKIDVGLNISKAEKDLQKLKDKIVKAEEQINANEAKKSEIEQQMEKAAQAAEAANQKVKQLKEEYNGLRKSARAEMKPRLDNAMANYRESARDAERLGREYQKLDESIQKSTKDIAEMKQQAGDMTRAIARAKLGEQIARSMAVAKKSMMTFLKYSLGIRSLFFLFRRLRAYISDAVSAFAKGDEETTNNINALKASLSTLKASWGAAFAPILNVVAPLLQKLIGWLTTAANAINMFFSALQGKTSYKKVVSGMDSAASSASGAASAAEDAAEASKEAKKQLMDFDEIRTLDEPEKNSKASGGGGGGGGLVQTEEEMINPKMKAFAEWIKDHLLEIKLLAGTIGALLLAWRLSRKLGLDFKKTLGVIMIVYGAILLIKGAIDAWKNGLSDGNIQQMLGGIAVAAAGAALAFGTVGGAIALLIGGIAMLVLGFKELVTQGELTDEAFRALAIGIGLVGIAFALLTGQWIPLVVAAVAILVLTIVKYWDEIKAKAIEIWNAIKEWIVNTWEAIKQKAINVWTSITNWVVQKWNGLKTTAVNIWTSIRDSIVGVFDSAKTKIQGVWDDITGWFESKWNDLKTWWENLSLNPFNIMTPHLEWSWNEVDGVVGKILSTLGLPAQIPHLDVSWYARGGIFDDPTIIGVGENGQEAVVPLEKNTRWIDLVADSLASKMAGGDFASQLASAFASVPMPAMAGGFVAPPNAISGSGGGGTQIMEELRALRGEIAALANQPIELRSNLYMDKRKVGESVTEYQRSSRKAGGV